MKSITLCLCTSWTLLLMVHELLAAGDVSLCSEEGIFPRSDHCRLLILCLKSKTQSSQWKEYLLSCPYGLNFNHFMMSCYDFEQECALEKGAAVDNKLANAWSLTLPNEPESCKGAKAPFCTDDKMLTICHPFSKKLLGYVNCKEKDAAHGYCDKEEGMCKRRTSSVSTTEIHNASGVTEEIAGANYLRVVVLCSASLNGTDAKRCVELFGKEYECLASEDRCPVYIAELIKITDGSILQSVEASIHIYASMGNMNVQTIVGRPTNESVTQNQFGGDIINGAMKLQKCQKPGGNCLSDGDTLMDCFDSLHIKRAYRCSDIYGNLAECVPKLQECVELEETGYMNQGRSDSFRRTKGGPHNSVHRRRGAVSSGYCGGRQWSPPLYDLPGPPALTPESWVRSSGGLEAATSRNHRSTTAGASPGPLALKPEP